MLVVGLDPAAASGAAAWLGELSRGIARAPDLAASAGRSGPALAIAIYAAASRSPRRELAEPGLVVSVGDAVRRGVPTAARATLSGRAPLRPGISEAQVGGPLGRALSAHADALVLLGNAGPASIVEVNGLGEVRVHPAERILLPLGAAQRARALSGSTRAAHVLGTGPGAQAGLPFANLASFDGADLDAAPSVVGRGGLGATLARVGVLALAVEEAASVEGAMGSTSTGDLESALVRSPRLLTRAAGGTLELAASRGSALEVEGPRRKHGCVGCPTPCGWSFNVSDAGGTKVGGRFSALQGFADRGDPLALLERCNHLGVDARTVAALMGTFGASSSEDFFADLLEPGSAIHSAALDAAERGGGGATFAEGDLAAEVGQALAVRGPEPLRSLSILGLEGEKASRMIAPLPWSGEPARDAGTLAFWHECVAAALDVSGFCSFSAAGLLADGVMGLGELAAALAAPPEDALASGDRGAEFVRTGAAHLALHREVMGEVMGATSKAQAALAERHPMAVEAYLAARSLGSGARGTPLEVGPSGHPAPEAAGDPSGDGSAPADSPAGPGVLTVLARGPLGARLAAHPGRLEAAATEGVELEIGVPASGLTGLQLLEQLSEDCPGAAPWLLDPDGRPLPAVLQVEPRGGEPGGGTGGEPRVAGAMRHGPGSVIELVLAIPGG